MVKAPGMMAKVPRIFGSNHRVYIGESIAYNAETTAV
jgi:hypothetical protein